MTREEKQLLLRDLCARLPYGVKFACGKNVYTAKGLDLIVTDEGDWEYAVTAKGIVPIEIKYIKPYLRPISSMTLEENIELKAITKGAIQTIGLENIVVTTDKGFDYLSTHHFDYRIDPFTGKTLIESGLAIEAPEDMYKTE